MRAFRAGRRQRVARQFQPRALALGAGHAVVEVDECLEVAPAGVAREGVADPVGHA